jgi:predicted nucleotidyltransferase
MHAYLAERKKQSDERLDAFRERLKTVTQTSDEEGNEDLCIYVTGSYGRGESDDKSDFDLFIASSERTTIKRERQYELFAELIKINRSLTKKPFSRNADFLEIHSHVDLRGRVGLPRDDVDNTFTARMLLLLEGKLLVGRPTHTEVLEGILTKYFTDYMWHTDDFQPRFLLNDITRYWKTLCLNYEAFRKRGSEDREDNLKLRYSRKLTCFATVVAILAKGPGIQPKDVRDLTGQVPLERLHNAVVDKTGDETNALRTLEESYAHFLQLTEQIKQTPGILIDDDRWREEKVRSLEFGKALVEILGEAGGDDAMQLVAL